MIREIKIKKDKFGSIISSFVEGVNTPHDAEALKSNNSVSDYVTIHTLGAPKEVANGVNYVRQKTGPKLKQAIGHEIQQVRGDKLVAFIKPSVLFIENAERIFQYAESNRMERSYGFFIGPADNPHVVGFAGALMPHIFHAVPDDMDMTGDEWIQFIHKWAPRNMMHHRYFDATELCRVAVPGAILPVSTQVVVGGIGIEESIEPIAPPTPEEVEQAVAAEKRKKAWSKRKG